MTLGVANGNFCSLALPLFQQHQSGQPVAYIVREHGISEAPFYTWETKYAGL